MIKKRLINIWMKNHLATFEGLFCLLSPWVQYLHIIDCPGPVVSQRLSPLTNPFAVCQPPLLLCLKTDRWASSHCNYTVGPAGHLFYYFHHLPKKKNRPYLQNPALSCATVREREREKKVIQNASVPASAWRVGEWGSSTARRSSTPPSCCRFTFRH